MDEPEHARERLLELLESDDCKWRFTHRAELDSRLALRWLYNREPREVEIIDYIISLLKANTALRCAPQGNPPGSTGIAWQMTDPQDVFIKLQILEARIGEEYVLIQSIHPSNPQ